MTTPTPGQPLSEADVKRIFGLDPNATGNRPRGWRIVDEGESNDIRAFNGMDVPPGSLAVSTRDGASNPISPTACQYPNFIGTVEDDYDRTYRDYFYRPHAPVSRPAGEGEREAVARIIDPVRWRRFDRHPHYADHIPRETQIEWSAALQDSLTKADAILSLLRPAAPDAGQNSEGK